MASEKFTGKILLSGYEASTALGISYAALRELRYRGVGPGYIRIGRLVRYPVADLNEWVAERKSGPRIRRRAGGR